MDIQPNDIEKASTLIEPYIHRTPVLTCSTLNDMTGKKLFFKCENFQKCGAFKCRGACNAVMQLNQRQLKKGVATHSSGNHAAALAYAARLKNSPAFIVMPKDAPQVKRQAVAGYGAQIEYCQPTLAARETTLRKVVDKTGAFFIHPYDDCKVIAGQGTVAYELMQKHLDLDAVMVPVGGGGLLSGTALFFKSISPNIQVYGCEPELADDAYRSFYSGHLIPAQNSQTIADGLKTSLSERTLSLILKYVDALFCASENNIMLAMRLIWERMKIIVEPSAAVPLAVLLQHKEKISFQRIGIILSGGNIDLNSWRW